MQAAATLEAPEPTQQQRRMTFWALMIVFLLSALDQTIVSTAMPRIVQELKGLDVYAWVTTTYLLTSTVMVPIWGKLGDLYGRKLHSDLSASASSSRARGCAALRVSSAICRFSATA